MDSAYAQLRSIVQTFNLPIIYCLEDVGYTSQDILSLAREAIQYASNMIINALTEPKHLPNSVVQQELSGAFEKILALYMTPDCLFESSENIQRDNEVISSSKAANFRSN